MKKYNIIYFSMSRYSEWSDSGVVNRNYHLLHTLLKNDLVNSIISVDFFPFNWKRAVKVFFHDLFLHDRRGEVIFGNLTSRAWTISSKLTVYSTINSLLSPARVNKELQGLIARLGMKENLVVINSNPLYANYFNALGQEINVFDAVDDWLEHASHQDKKSILKQNYKDILNRSDIFYTVSEDLAQKFNGQRTRWLPNAVDFDHYQNKEVHPSLQGLKKPILGFLGILQERINTELIEKVAQNFPEASIVLAGPVWKAFPKETLERYDNIVFTGPVRYEDIPRMYAGFDLGLIFYKNNAFIKSTNSMKYYEYLAAGLPVVSTFSGGVERFDKIIYISKTDEEFIDNIKLALTENSEEKRQQRKDFVKPMSWKNRVETLISDLDKVVIQ